jgi:hypothetical protein
MKPLPLAAYVFLEALLEVCLSSVLHHVQAIRYPVTLTFPAPDPSHCRVS